MIYTIYKYGSAKYGHVNEQLVVPKCQWIGYKLSDLDESVKKETSTHDMATLIGLEKKLHNDNTLSVVSVRF